MEIKSRMKGVRHKKGWLCRMCAKPLSVNLNVRNYLKDVDTDKGITSEWNTFAPCISINNSNKSKFLQKKLTL
jgi:hypothetical protein